MSSAPETYRVHPEFAADELDYADLVILAETYVRWAFEEPGISPYRRTYRRTGKSGSWSSPGFSKQPTTAALPGERRS